MVLMYFKKGKVSNKGKTLPEKLDEGPQEPIKPPPPAHHLKPFIDKISIVVSFPDDEEAKLIYKAIHKYENDPAVFVYAGPKTKWGKFNFAKRIPLTKSSQQPLFQAESKFTKTSKIRLEFNPRKVGADGLVELHFILSCLIDNGWDCLLQYGKITRLDIAVDIPNVRPGAFAILPQQGLTTKLWAVDGQLETFTLGKPHGNQTLLYNKKKKRLSQKQTWVGPATTRVERRLRNPSNSSLKDLPKVANPFHALNLVQVPDDAPGDESQSWVWDLFKAAVAVHNLPAALALVPKERRTKYRAHLEKHKHELWDADAIWNNWPAALSELKMHIPK